MTEDMSENDMLSKIVNLQRCFFEILYYVNSN